MNSYFNLKPRRKIRGMIGDELVTKRVDLDQNNVTISVNGPEPTTVEILTNVVKVSTYKGIIALYKTIFYTEFMLYTEYASMASTSTYSFGFTGRIAQLFSKGCTRKGGMKHNKKQGGGLSCTKYFDTQMQFREWLHQTLKECGAAFQCALEL
eukprot:4372661-Ditylum_brightwellii.AAC.1